MTVEEALRLPVLERAKLVTYLQDAVGRSLTWVSVIEVPVGKFVREGEFVLSTGMEIGRNPVLLTRFVRAVARCGASALAIAVGPHTPSLPPQTVSAANRARLPLIELPWEVRFSEISEAVIKGLLAAQTELQERAELRSRSDFIWSLASGGATEQAAAAQGKRFGYDPAAKYVAVAGRLSRTAGEPASAVEARLKAIERLCGKAAAEERLHWIGTIAGDGVIAYVQAPQARERIRTLLSAPRRQYSISWGIGRVCDRFPDFKKSYEEAVLACGIGRSITDICEIAADRLLLKFKDDPDALALLDRYIEPLKRVHRPPLLSTLEAFFENECNVSQTARKLSISRQSLFYRLAKAEVLLKTDLRTPDMRFALSLALRIHKLGNVS